MLMEQTNDSAAREEGALPPAPAALMQLLFGKHVTCAVSAIARLGVPDHMATDQAVSIESLAAATGTHASSLYRVMRMLSCVGVCEEATPRSFRLLAVGELLKNDATGSLRNFAIQCGDTWAVRSFEHFPETLQTGVDSVTLAFGRNIFEYFADEPDEAETFNRSMTNISAALVDPLIEAYDFSGILRLADIGGGHGMLLSEILKRYPEMRGVVYDLPNVVAGRTGNADEALSGRLAFEAGNFFERVSSGCDGYLMKFILHDWSDDSCIQILNAIRREMPLHGRLLVCEQLISDGQGSAMAKFLDIEMLAMTAGGRERTAEEFSQLFAAAGLRLNRVVPTRGPLFILEATL